MTERVRVSSGSPLEPVIGFSRAVRVGNLVSVAGTGPMDANGQLVGKGDMKAQSLRCLEIIAQALEDAGASVSDVVRTRVFVTDVARWKDAAEAHGEMFGDIRPATTFVEVTAFVNPDWLVEIEADAVIAE